MRGPDVRLQTSASREPGGAGVAKNVREEREERLGAEQTVWPGSVTPGLAGARGLQTADTAAIIISIMMFVYTDI